MIKNLLFIILFFTLLNKLQAQQKSTIQLPDSKIGAGMVFKLKDQEAGFSARYQLACGEKTSVVFSYSRGYFFKINEERITISTTDVDLDAHYDFLKHKNMNLYILGGFNINSRKWTGLYNDSYLKNVDLWGGINAGTGIELMVNFFSIYGECKTTLFDRGLFAGVGIMYHFHERNKKGKIVKSRNLR